MAHLADRWPLQRLSLLNQAIRVEHGSIVGRAAARTKVCITGNGIGKDEAPLDDPSWEVWALNLVVPTDRNGCARADVWFDLHQRCAQSDDDLRWIAMCPFPIYVPPDLRSASVRSVHFPLAEIEAAFGSYFACTFAYQIALVLYEGWATDLGLYGVELALGTARERSVEWACVSYWLGRAEERGLRIHLPTRSSLGRHPYRYGFEYDAELKAVERYTDVMQDISAAQVDFAGTQREFDDLTERYRGVLHREDLGG